MNIVFILCFLFSVGSVLGWVMEVFFRKFIASDNVERKWENPGFCMGPYLPIYGSGVCALYLICGSSLGAGLAAPARWLARLLVMTLCMNGLEFGAGVFLLKVMRVRLWDYSTHKGNIMGVICPSYSLLWAAAGAVYMLADPYVRAVTGWFGGHMYGLFFTGMFYGVFFVDVAYSAHLIMRIKRFAEANQVIIRYGKLKDHINTMRAQAMEKTHFLLSFVTKRPLIEYLTAAKGRLDAFADRLPGFDRKGA